MKKRWNQGVTWQNHHHFYDENQNDDNHEGDNDDLSDHDRARIYKSRPGSKVRKEKSF